MVRRNADGTLFVGEVVEEVKRETPKAEQPSLDDIMGDKFLIDEPQSEPEKPKNKGGRPKRK